MKTENLPIDENPENEITDEGVAKVKKILTPVQKKAVMVVAIIFAIYQLVTIFYPLNIISQRILHLLFGLSLIFATKPASSKNKTPRITILDFILIALSIISCGYIAMTSSALMLEKLGLYTNFDVIISIVVILLVLEAARRLFGWIMPSIATIALIYALYGNFLPGIVGHRGYSVYRVSTTLVLWTEGILGSPLGVSATFVAVFVIFGAFLNKTSIGEFFVRVAYSMFGRVRGGPAKASIIGSGLMGSVSGSAVANVVGTGTFTIPLMKRVGFSPRFAGAVEAVASSGGQLMPPVMGATAFIMAEMVGKPYSEIVTAAIIPAFFYYIVLFYTVDVRSAKIGLIGEKPEDLENWKELVKKQGFLFLPILALIIALVGFRVSTGRAALIGLITVILVSIFNKQDRMTIKKFFSALEEGGYAMLDIVSVTAIAGIISGVLSLTGLGLKISGLLINLAGGNLLILLILCMIVSLIAGMGLPIVACYLLLAVIVAPALIDMGVAVLAAHLFIFIFGIFSAITPPVAIAAYVAGGVADADPMKTGYTAWKLALPLFIIPYAFVYEPALLLVGPIQTVVISCITALLGLFGFASGLEGFIWKYQIRSRFVRIALSVGSVAMIIPETMSDIIGIIIIVATILYTGMDEKAHKITE